MPSQWHENAGIEDTDQNIPPHNGSHSLYLRNKITKLDNQANKSVNHNSHIFGGCIVYITGYTVPSAAALKRLIVGNGGRICAYFGGKKYATHIIASSLTSRKKEQYSSYVVCRPEWVVDSVQAGKRLDWKKYNLLGPCDDDIRLEVHEESDDNEQENEFNNEEISTVSLRSEQVKWVVSQRSRVNCLDPLFLKNYFGNSRLHFLSITKLELRRKCRLYMSESKRIAALEPPALEPIKRTLMHVDYDSFFVAVVLKKHPNLRHLPVCVSHGSDGSDIASCNYVAREKGVKNGMWVSKAKMLCPELICLPYDFEEFRRCTDILYDVLLGLQPTTIVALSVDEAIVDVSSIKTPIDELCTRIRTEIREKSGIEVSTGVGANVLQAKLALKLAKPAGQHIITNFSQVQHLEINRLPGVGSKIASKLQTLQCETISDLKSVPLLKLQDEFGSALGYKLYGYGLGTDTVDIEQLDAPVQSLGIDVTWGVRVVNKAEQDSFTLSCVSELYGRIDKADFPNNVSYLYTVKVHVRSPDAPFITTKYMGHGHCVVTSRSITIPGSITLEQLQQTTREMINAMGSEALDFRGLGLHVKPKFNNSTPQNIKTLDNYFPLGRPSPSGFTSPQTSPQKKRMYSIPPRKKPKKTTLTQLVRSDEATYIDQEIDMEVLAELPEYIQQEVIREHRVAGQSTSPKLSQPSASFPSYSNPLFMGLNGKELREVLKKWVTGIDSPGYEDSKQFYTYACDAVRRSRWCDVLDIMDWLEYLCKTRSGWKSEGWRLFYETLDSRIQQLANQHTK